MAYLEVMQNPILYARPLGAGPNFAGPLFRGGALNPSIPAPVREELMLLWRDHGGEEGSDEEAWRRVYEDLAHPGRELGGHRVFVRLRDVALPGTVSFVTGGEEGDHERWWLEYNVTLPEDKRVPEPSWPELARLKRELEKASAHFFRQHMAAYQGTSGIYVGVLLDLGDRPLELTLHEDGYVALEAPLHTKLPLTLRARNYVLEHLAYVYDQFNFRVDGGSILVARTAGRIPAEDVGGALAPFIEGISEAAVELRRYLARSVPERTPRRQKVEAQPPPGKTLCINVYTRKRGLVYTGPLVQPNGVFSTNIPVPILDIIMISWDRHCARYRGDKIAFAMEQLIKPLTTSPWLAQHGYAVRFFWSDEPCKEDARY